MTLANIRTGLWRGGVDLVLVYKTNGRRQINTAPPPEDPFADEHAEPVNGSEGP
jgi:hypothetical protein